MGFMSGASRLEQALFVMLVGIAGVFFVLIVFYFLIKLLGKVFPNKTGNENS